MDIEKFNSEMLITNALIRISVLENILISKGIIDAKEHKDKTFNMTADIMRKVLQNVKTPEEIEEIVKNYKNSLEQ